MRSWTFTKYSPNQFLQAANTRLTPSRSLQTTWFDSWHPALDEALKSLPEIDLCPRELYRLLMQNPGPVQKRTALIAERGVPVAVVGLRQTSRLSWELATQWLIPGMVFPVQPGYLLAALEALGSDIQVAWWRMAGLPPSSQWMRSITSTPTYRLHRLGNFEQYWRDNGYFKTVRRVRNRCQGLTPVVNSPGLTEWTIKNWEASWRTNSTSADPALADRIMIAKHLENLKRSYTITLLDRDTPVGGATMTVHHKDLVAGVLYRDPRYHAQGIGDRLIDLSFSLAAENGFETFDIGGGHNYKKHWAPQAGEHWQFNICPEHIYRAKQMVSWARLVRAKVIRRTNRGQVVP